MNPTQTDNLSSVFNGCGRCPMFVVNSAGKILRTNQRAAMQLGRRKGDLRGANLSDFLHVASGEALPIGVAGPDGGAASGLRKGELVPPAGDAIEVEVVVQAVDRRDPGRYLILAKEPGVDCSVTPDVDTRLREIAEAQERERQRVARELHDEALQSLLVAGIEVERLMQGTKSRESLPGGSLLHLQRLLREVENDIRQI